MKIGDLVRVKWPNKHAKKSLGIAVECQAHVVGVQGVLVMMYHDGGGKQLRWVPENRLEVIE